MEFDLNEYFHAEDKGRIKFATISCKEKNGAPTSDYIIKKTKYRPRHINADDPNRPFYLLDIIQDPLPATSDTQASRNH